MEREFNGKKVPWVAEGRLNPEDAKKGKARGEEYAPAEIERRTKIGYNEGTLVFLIDDASGNTWIIKVWSRA